MAITYRAIKGSKLTISEIDSNFSYLDDRISDIDSAYIETIVDSNYVQVRSGTITVNKFYFEADSGDTVFSGNDYFGNAMTYDSNSALVYLNGMMLMEGIDYTLTSGNSVTTAVGIDSGHLITITSMELV